MNVNLLDLSGKIDDLTIGVMDAIVQVADELNIRFFLIGATARDLVLHHGYGINPGRATQDIDLAIEVSYWAEFASLEKALLQTNQFETDRQPQRLRYKKNFPVDIVPFGEISGKKKEIRWPSDRDTRMQVLGFEDAFQSARLTRLRAEPPLDILIASPAGLALLKLVAWNDRLPPEKYKDALDLALLLRVYMDADNQERLFADHTDLLAGSIDYEQVGARLLGRDVAVMASRKTKQALVEILERETDEQGQYRLVGDMIRGDGSSTFESHLELLEAFQQGIIESNIQPSRKDGPKKGG